MNYIKVRKELQKKTENELQKYQYLGAEIKNSRLKMAKTLESMINISKSVSYISKVENNKIIPNKECLEELCDELSINKESLQSMSNFEESLYEAIIAIYNNDTDKITNLYNKYKVFTNVRTDLMKGLYYLHTNNYKELRIVVKNLNKIESNLIISDYIIYVLICIFDLLNKDEILSVYKIIQILKDNDNTNQYILLIIKRIEFKIKLDFTISSVGSDFKDLFSDYIKTFNKEEAMGLNVLYTERKVEICDHRNLKKLFDSINDNKLKFYISLHLNDQSLIEQYFNNDLPDKYLIKYYFLNNDINSLNSIIENNNLKKDLLIIANYYKLNIEGNVEILRDYIINICIPYFKQKCMINELLMIYNELIYINSSISKYKESTLISKEIINLIQEIISISL